jgi:radical SAM protein with 4Fe4S-binding SPASM domain
VRGIENALAGSVHAITNTTLMRCNMDEIEETIDFLYDLGIRTFAMNGMIYSGGGFADPNAIPEEAMPPLLIRVRDHAADRGMRFLWYTPTEYCRMSPVELEIGAKRCNAGEYSICVEPNGDVLPCQSYYTSAGNILRDPWQEIWQGELFRSFRDREEDPRWAGLPEKCWECPDLPLCGGGCRIEREARDGRRTGDGGGGGCSGCSGSCGTGSSRANHNMLASAGYVPPLSVTSHKVRATGQMSGLIGLDTIAYEDSRPVPLRVADQEHG